MSYLDAEAVVSRLDGARRSSGGWIARCPVHEDRAPSLSVHDGKKGTVLSCHAGCSINAITTALGFRVAELFIDYNGGKGASSNVDTLLREMVRKQREDEPARAHHTLGDVMWWAFNGEEDDWFRTYEEHWWIMDMEFEVAYKMWRIVADTVVWTYLLPWWQNGKLGQDWSVHREGAMRKLLRTWQKEKRYANGQ